VTLDRSHTRYEKSGGTAVLTLARPDNRNAITGPEMLSEVIGAIDDAESDPEVGVLVITGDGPAFSAGGNIKDMADRTGLFAGTPEEMTEGYRSTIQNLTRTVLSVDLANCGSERCRGRSRFRSRPRMRSSDRVDRRPIRPYLRRSWDHSRRWGCLAIAACHRLAKSG